MRHMERRSVWPSVFLLLAAACAGDRVTSPGVCPEYCPAVTVQAVDTVLVTAISDEASFRGYQRTDAAHELQVSGPGSLRESRAIFRIPMFGNRMRIVSGDTTTTRIAVIDSFRLELDVRRYSPGSRISVHRLPADLSDTTGFDGLTPWFHDSTRIVDFEVRPDTLTLERVQIPAAAFPMFLDDSSRVRDSVGVRLGLAVSSPGTSVDLGAVDAGSGALLVRYLGIDSTGGVRVKRADSRFADFDNFLFRPLDPAPAGVLLVGGAPAWRTFLRLNVPARILDSTTVIRATVLFLPAGSAAAPGDTVRILAHLVTSDVGPKTPVAMTAGDSLARAGGYVPPGSTDTVRVDVTGILRAWRGDTVLPRVIVLKASPEAGGWSEARLWSSAMAAMRPRLQITYVPPVYRASP